MPEIRPMGRGGPRNAGFMSEPEKAHNSAATLKRLIHYIGKARLMFAALLAVMPLITLLGLAAPTLQKLAIDAITIDGENKLKVDFAQLGYMLALLMLVYILQSIFSYLQGIYSARLSQITVYEMRQDLFKKLVHLPIGFTDKHKHGDLMSRMTNDVENISNAVSQSIGSLISSVLTLAGSLAVMIYYSPLLTLISVSTIFLTFFFSAFMSKRMRKYFTAGQQLLGSLNGHIEETVSGYRTVVAFGKQDYSRQKFEEINLSLKKAGIYAQIFGGAMGPCMNFISNSGFLLVAVFGGLFALKGTITIGTIQAFILYSKQFSRPINEIANQYAQIETALAGAERVFEIIDAPTENLISSEISLSPESVTGNISFNNVNFSYTPEKAVLNSFNLNVSSGEKIAIVGATGSGKTTVVNLLTRFYETNSGEITIDGNDIKKLSLETLRNSIGIVLQDTVLFDGTVGENIRYGNLNATDDEVISAAEASHADTFIEKLSDSYETVLSESGRNLSQGQRQLLSIARAVLKNPRILILDEATSSVDTRTEMHIQSAMVKLMENRTSLIIAHRLSTIRGADRIIVIENGHIAEEGCHDELIAQRGAYYRLYNSQFAGIQT